MSHKNKVVYGIFSSRADVENTVSILRQHHFRNTDVSILFSETSSSKDFGLEKTSKAPEGAAAGAGTGALLGGVLGWLAGIGALAIPAVGPLIAAGPIVALLAGAGVGSTLGGVTGGLIGMGIPEYEAKRFEGLIKRGRILLSVHCDDSTWTAKAKKVLLQTGAQDVSATTEARASIKVDDHNRVHC